MDGVPDGEVEGDLETGVLLVVGGLHLDVERDAHSVRVDLAQADDAFGTTKVAEELVGHIRIAEPDDHLSHSRAEHPPGKS